MRTKSYSAFDSINYPVVAFIDEKRILQYVESGEEQGELRFYEKVNPKVFLMKLIPGMEPEILWYIGSRYDAIIIESYGAGGIPFYNNRNFLQSWNSLPGKGRLWRSLRR